MHIEVLVEDSSGARLVDVLLPSIIGGQGQPHTWRIHDFKGIGRIPQGLAKKNDPLKATLLDRLPNILRAHGKTQGIDAIVVVLDTDTRDCRQFLGELNMLLDQCEPAPRTLFRLAIEEIEAWYFGDRNALVKAFPKVKKEVLGRYRQDTVCHTWELLADAVHPGGRTAIQKAGWPLPGQIKHEWAARIGPLMDVERNESPSFGKLRDGLRRLVSTRE